MRIVRTGIMLAAGLMAASCAERDLTRPAVPPSYLISDAVHNNGKPHFFFLPPMVPTPVATGTFDAALSPEVQVCRMAGDECEETIAIFTDSTDWGSERVRISSEDESYIVNWHTDASGLRSDATYRIRILVNGIELGFADLDVVDSGRELRNVNTNDYIPLVDGRTLPVKFRVETGFLAGIAVTPDEATVNVGETRQFSATLTDLHGAAMSGLTVTWVSSDGAVGTVDQSGLATGVATGSTTISALAAGVEGMALLTVVEPVPVPSTVAMPLDPSWTQAVATDVNDAGLVVGYAHPAAGAGQRRAFRWTGVPTDTMEVLPAGGATWCEAQGIGNLGTIVGTCSYPGVGGRGVTWTGGGDPVPLPWPTALMMNSTARGIYEDATAMRITGSVTRNYTYTCSFNPPCTGVASNPAIWTSTDGAPPTTNPVQLGWNGNVNGASGLGEAVNALGQATGQRSEVVAYSPCFQCFFYIDILHGFRFSNPGTGSLGVVYIYPYNTGRSGGLGINRTGTIVGWVDDYSQSNSNATRHRAVRWSGGAATRLTIPGVPAPTVTGSEAHDVNDLGWIVGLYAGNAFVWKNGANPAEVLEPLAAGKSARAHAISDVVDGRMYVAGSGVGLDNRTVPVRWTLVVP